VIRRAAGDHSARLLADHYRISAELLEIPAHRARILHPAMDHLLLAIALDLKIHLPDRRQKTNRKQRHKQQQDEENVALFLSSTAGMKLSFHTIKRSRKSDGAI